MRKVHHIFAFFLLALPFAWGQTTFISTAPQDPAVRPEQLTATIVHYVQMRTSARRTIQVLALALQNSDSPKVILNAINKQEDVVDSANWCILALRDKIPGGEMCIVTRAEVVDQSQKGVCQLASNSVVRAHCSQGSGPARSIRND